MNVVLGLGITILLVDLSARITHSNIIALCVGLIAATHPTLVHYSCQILRENSFILFGTLLWIIMLEYYKRGLLMYVLLGGVISAMSFMCRLEGMEFVFVYTGLILLRENNLLKNKIKRCLIYLACFALTVAIVIEMLNVNYSYVSFKEKLIEKTSNDPYR